MENSTTEKRVQGNSYCSKQTKKITFFLDKLIKYDINLRFALTF